jgi:hypothetical protein
MINFKRAITVYTLLLFFVCPFSVSAETNSVFYFSANCIEAQKHIASLRLNKAAQLLAEEKTTHSNNAAVFFLENHVDFYRIVTSQDFTLIKEMERQKSARFNKVSAIPESSPYRLYAQSEMYLQYAFVKVFNEEYVGAMLAFRSAYNLALENQKKFPAFKQHMKTLGMFKALLGTAPKSYRWMLSVAGLKGDFDGGMSMLEQYLKNGSTPEQRLDEQSAVFYYTLLQLNFGDKALALSFCKTHTEDYNTNLLSCYLRAFVTSKSAQTDEAIKVLNGRPRGADYETFVALEYYLGFCKLNRLDDDADIHFKKFTTAFKGKLFMKDAYRRLYWFYLIRNEPEKAAAYKLMSKKYSTGNNEEEKNVQREIEQGLSPDLILLKARLLCDGGYYTQAEEVIKQHQIADLKTDYQKLEYYYRYGRILQELNKWSKATECYGYVIKNSPLNTPYYFAPNACLQMGYIYKKLGFKQIAKSHFANVKKYSNAEYIQNFEVKAEKEMEKL